MSYNREWADRRNAAGFAAECARLALVFYKGDHRSDLVAAIELTERYAGGEKVDCTDLSAATVRAANVENGYIALYAVRTATYAIYSADEASSTATLTTDVELSADYAAHAGADDHEIQAAHARWVVRDLSCGRELPVLLRQAAGAAVVAGDEALALEILA